MFSRRRAIIGAASVLGGAWAYAKRDYLKRILGLPISGTCPFVSDAINFDELGLIVQSDCDGGDTAQREGMYWFGNWIRVNLLGILPYGAIRSISFSQVMDYLEDEPRDGKFRRHPTQERWKHPKDVSRDQLVPLIAAMGVLSDFQRLDRFRDTLRRGIYFVNKDFLLLHEEFIKRARGHELALGGFIDRELLDKAVDLRLDAARKDMDDVGDDLNLIVQLLLPVVRMGSQIEAIRARYVRERPRNYGIYLGAYRTAYPNDVNAGLATMIGRIQDGIQIHGWKPDCPCVEGAMRWYFRVETGASSGICTLYEPILARYFAGVIPE